MRSRNEPCWCGSGRKYKRCHLLRAEQSPLPRGRLFHDLEREFDKKECLHPQAALGVCNKVIAAHTIQRSGGLARIVDGANKVLRFNPFKPGLDGRPVLESIGWREASTFKGFCGRHDNEVFSPLEKKPFRGTPEQCFLVGYRALCHELYQKSASIRAQLSLRELWDRGRPEDEQQQIHEVTSVFLAGSYKGLENNQALKSHADAVLLSRNFSAWERYVVYFRGDIAVVSTGAPTPTFDLWGRSLQILREPTTPIEPLYYGVLATDEGGAIVFTWPRGLIAPHRFIDSLESLPVAALPGVLAQFMFAHVSNTFFSVSWWQALNEVQQAWVQELAGMFEHYAKGISYKTESLVNWDVTGTTRA